MIDLSKHKDFFDPSSLKSMPITIIGVGAVGSYIAQFLAKLGIGHITIYDMDVVDDHNITNQVYTGLDIGKPKTEAIKEHMVANNDELVVECKGRYTGEEIQGIVFLEVDSMNVRKQFAEANEFNDNLKYVFDGRIGLDTCQLFSINWEDEQQVKDYISEVSSFQDTDVSVPVSACGLPLSVSPTVVWVAARAVANFVNMAKGEHVARFTYMNPFEGKSKTIF